MILDIKFQYFICANTLLTYDTLSQNNDKNNSTVFSVECGEVILYTRVKDQKQPGNH